MEEGRLIPDYIFEVSWEVCNKVGGIYTVLSTRAKSLQTSHKDRIIFIGPDLNERNAGFTEDASLLIPWRQQTAAEGLKIRVGRWDIPGHPMVILVDYTDYYSNKDQIFTDLWNWFGVDSLHAYGDYDESCLFAWACGKVIKSFYDYSNLSDQNVVAHFNEWTTGFGLLFCKQFLPNVATVFTTHATSIGRSICGNNKPLYDFMSFYNGDMMARELNMVSKHSVEKLAARHANCFTTVSDITAKECRILLEKNPDIVTPNGFEDQFVPKGKKAEQTRMNARNQLTKVAEALCGCTLSEDVLFLATSGRYEFRNKGLDVFIDSLYKLSKQKSLEREIVAFLLVPGDVSAPRQEVLVRMADSNNTTSPLYYPWTTHWLNHIENDNVLRMIQYRGFKNSAEDKVKIILVPCYLNGSDGILNMPYYDLLSGFDLTVFPSYYEPWGYTPLESIAFSIPTITTNLAGFGAWALQQGDEEGISDGVAVLNRNDHNVQQVADAISLIILDFARKSDNERKLISDRAQKLSQKAHWSEFIESYYQAYDLALRKVTKNYKTTK
ncbi:MAG TPA: glycogen/starch synthase [Bacteroidales bacterium]|nr:glycogen/starch synthase [Bacteroidales bacterium]